MNDYKEKIKKLLALAGSSNEHEAKSALLKARQLMAEHKLTEKDFETSNREVMRIDTGIKYTMRSSKWVPSLANIIGEKFGCQPYFITGYRSQTKKQHFMGLSEDVAICVEIFKYAYECIQSGIEKTKKTHSGCTPKASNALVYSYALGFCQGIREAYCKQDEENGWGLVLSIPREVQEERDRAFTCYKARTIHTRISTAEYNNGLNDGREFSPEKKLA